ncbi:hypothetical protein F4778DRAFT_651754 [Xylariomycetidae sp. FL2044]|nr:hypothetical protein F4778DRAFT_651754 [Xylariomycetidae sp. FL2044]
MLDENLPSFFYRQSDNPLINILYFTQNGSEPTAEYSLRKLDPTLPQARNKYAVALGDAAGQNIIFAEVLIEPEFQQPTLSAAEIRAQNGVPPAPIPMIPDAFTLQLYNPDQKVVVRGEKSTWTGKESWDFEMPQQSFRMPSASTLDRQQSDPTVSSTTPKIMFRWKRDSKFSKDMTCYMTGRSVGGKKSKDPDITIAMYKHGRQQSVTIYEPNLQRVEVEDRKGLEVVLLLGADVIREIYLFPSRDSFNLNGAAPPPNKRKNSRPIPGASAGSPTNSTAANPYDMTSAVGSHNIPPTTNSPVRTQHTAPPQKIEIDAETKRLQAMVQKEEEKERKRREKEVAKETERLRREFGMAGQDFSAAGSSGGNGPSLPPRPSGGGGLYPPAQQPPTRPQSAGPRPRPGAGGWFTGPVGPMPAMVHFAPGPSQPYPGGPAQQRPPAGNGRMRGKSADGGKMLKKKSTFF